MKTAECLWKEWYESIIECVVYFIASLRPPSPESEQAALRYLNSPSRHNYQTLKCIIRNYGKLIASACPVSCFDEGMQHPEGTRRDGSR